MNHIVSYSGGVGSWAAAKRVADRHGPENVTLLFADTLIEDEDLYRFLHEGAEHLGVDVTTIADGRDPWQVFRDVRYVGNSRVDPCSLHLKRNLIQSWLDEHCDPSNTMLHFGIDFTEVHRLDRYRKRNPHWTVEAPMCWDPVVSKLEAFGWLEAAGIKPPRLYDLGFQHNNCGGFCVKTGQAQFALLLRTMPERYRRHEEEQERTFGHIGKRHGFIRMTRNGQTEYLSLKEFREHLESQPDLFDKHDWGGCGCAIE